MIKKYRVEMTREEYRNALWRYKKSEYAKLGKLYASKNRTLESKIYRRAKKAAIESIKKKRQNEKKRVEIHKRVFEHS